MNFCGSCKNEILLGEDRLCAVAHRIVHDTSRAEDVIPDALRRFSNAWPHEVRLTKNGAKEDLALLMLMGFDRPRSCPSNALRACGAYSIMRRSTAKPASPPFTQLQ